MQQKLILTLTELELGITSAKVCFFLWAIRKLLALFFLLQTPTGMPANFKHVGPFLLIDAIPCYFYCCDRGKQSQLLLRPTKVQLGLQVQSGA